MNTEREDFDNNAERVGGALRETRRECEFNGWETGSRRGTMTCRHAEYDGDGFNQAAIQCNSDESMRAIMIGAFAPPAAANKMGFQTSRGCPRYKVERAGYERYVACEGTPGKLKQQRPNAPIDVPAFRLAWPLHAKDRKIEWNRQLRKACKRTKTATTYRKGQRESNAAQTNPQTKGERGTNAANRGNVETIYAEGMQRWTNRR